jgi:hypothetical protein
VKHEHKCRLKAARHLPAARRRAQRLQAEAEADLAEAEALKLQARLEDLNVWEEELVKERKKGSKDLHLTEMASWREGDRTRNVHLGSARKMDAEAARQKPRKMKAEALGMWACSYDLFHQPSEVAPKSKPNRKGETPICPSSQPWLYWLIL